MRGKPQTDDYSDEEAAKRMDATVRAMIATPPHRRGKPAPKAKTRTRRKAQPKDPSP